MNQYSSGVNNHEWRVKLSDRRAISRRNFQLTDYWNQIASLVEVDSTKDIKTSFIPGSGLVTSPSF